MRRIHGYISDYVSTLDPSREYSKLSILKKLVFKLFGIVALETVYVETPVGTRGTSKVYLARCPKCKTVFVDYEHGFNGYIECPRCGERI